MYLFLVRLWYLETFQLIRYCSLLHLGSFPSVEMFKRVVRIGANFPYYRRCVLARERDSWTDWDLTYQDHVCFSCIDEPIIGWSHNGDDSEAFSLCCGQTFHLPFTWMLQSLLPEIQLTSSFKIWSQTWIVLCPTVHPLVVVYGIGEHTLIVAWWSFQLYGPRNQMSSVDTLNRVSSVVDDELQLATTTGGLPLSSNWCLFSTHAKVKSCPRQTTRMFGSGVWYNFLSVEKCSSPSASLPQDDRRWS